MSRTLLVILAAGIALPFAPPQIRWLHLSSRTGDLPFPGESHQQTGVLVAKIDSAAGSDFVLSFRQKAPALVWYRRTAANTWTRYVIEDAFLPLEAGGAACDVDGDGDLDIVFGGDYQSNELWWWENPAPDFQPKVPWKRHIIKNTGAKQYHDQIFADFKRTGRPQLVFWNQKAKTIFLADIPPDPRHSGPWPLEAIFQDSAAPGGKSYPEGIDAVDVDGDGQVDLLAGNYWFKYTAGRFQPVRVGAIGGRIRAARFKPGRTAQIVIAPGDGSGPLRIYEAHGDPVRPESWVGRDLLDRDMIHGHTLDIGDVNGDGKLDILAAEMAQWTDGAARPDNPNATAWILYGDGKGNFDRTVLKAGDGWHEGKLGDFDGDGRLDIVNKPYTWDTPRIDVWLNRGGTPKQQ